MINLDKCRYNISSDTERSLKMLIENSLRWYLNKDNITFDDVQFLTTIMEIFPLLNNKEYWESIGYDICKGIKGRLENENRIMFLGMFSGLGKEAFAVNIFARRTGQLQTFSRKLNTLLLDFAYQYINMIESSTLFNSTQFYDVISGVSGVLYYLLDFEWEIHDKKKITAIVNYLLRLKDEKEYLGDRRLAFFVPYESLRTNSLRMLFPSGYLDLGVAHGIIGVGIALAKAYYCGYEADKIADFCIFLKKFYADTKKERNGIPVWPQQISWQEYINRTYAVNMFSRPSWCYGNLSIIKGFYKIDQYLRIKNSEENILILQKILEQSSNKFNFVSPCICHGIASLILIENTLGTVVNKQMIVKKIENQINEIKNLYENNRYIWKNDERRDFLTGVPGIICALCGLYLEDEYTSKLFLMD